MSASAEDILAAEAAGQGGNVVFCVGSVLRGDDAAGPLLAKRLEDDPVAGWSAVDGGQTPENDLGYLRRLAPERLLLVDAAAMGLEPGAIRRLRAEDVAVQSLITAHTLPITYLLGALEEMCDEVTFVGMYFCTFLGDTTMAFGVQRLVGGLCLVLGILLPISAFVACGFEHCVANMFFLPMGLVLNGAGFGVAGAVTLGGVAYNLVLATAGNIVGGLLVGMAYWFVYHKKQEK